MMECWDACGGPEHSPPALYFITHYLLRSLCQIPGRILDSVVLRNIDGDLEGTPFFFCFVGCGEAHGDESGRGVLILFGKIFSDTVK